MKWLLFKLDYLIHKVIPYPECKRQHWNATITNNSFTSNATATSGIPITYYWKTGL